MTASLPMDRSDLATPALILDLAARDRKIEAMAAFAHTRGIALRPHAKTDKSDGQVVLGRARATFVHPAVSQEQPAFGAVFQPGCPARIWH